MVREEHEDHVDISIPSAVTPATGEDFSKNVAVGPGAALIRLPWWHRLMPRHLYQSDSLQNQNRKLVSAEDY